MRLNSPRLGEVVAGVSGGVLLATLLLPWYRTGDVVCITIVGVDCPPAGGVNAFEAFGVLDVAVVTAALAGLMLLVLQVTQRTPAIAVAWAAITALLATFVTPFVLYRVIDAPGGAASLEPLFAFVGLAASCGVAVGAWLSMRDEGTGATVSAARARRRREEAELLTLPELEGPRRGGQAG